MATPNEESVLPLPNLKIVQATFVLLESKCSSLHAEAKKTLLAGIIADEMAPYLVSLLADSATAKLIQVSSTLVAELQEKNRIELERIAVKLEDAVKNLGETEISDALKEKALYLTKIGEKELAIEAHQAALLKSAGLGSKIDIRLAMIRIGFFHNDNLIISTNITAAQLLVEEGGDWDRRNRLKVYQGLHYLSIRNFKQGGELLLETISTFTATELIDYDDFVVLCVLAGVLTLERGDLKKKIIDSPEILALLPNLPSLNNFTDSLYKCDYAKFFQALAQVETHHLIPSKLLSVHTRFFVRELRIKAYGQLLSSYRSVTMKNLCDSFGVSEEFMDADLSRFIAAGRLNCSIDRVNLIVETNRPDAKNSRYEAVVKQGDVLLTSVQRLSRVIG